MFTRPGPFVVVLPVKSPGTAKTRLSTLADSDRARLAAAFATDVVDACLRAEGVAGVLVVSDDAEFAATLAARGAVAVDEPGGGLNAALRHGARVVHDEHSELQPVALCGDLPALRPADLSAALADAAMSGGACFVRDADGTGTSLYTAPYDAFEPRFGQDSAAAHESAGSRALQGDLASLRRDVNDLDGLSAAIALGVGEASAHAVAGVRLT